MTKLKKGTKPEVIKIKDGVTFHMYRVGNYIEIELKDAGEITKLRAKGFTNL